MDFPLEPEAVALDPVAMRRLASFVERAPGRISLVLLKGSVVGEAVVRAMRERLGHFRIEIPTQVAHVPTLVEAAQQLQGAPGGVLLIRLDGAFGFPGTTPEAELREYFELLNVHREAFGSGECRTVILMTPEIDREFSRIADDMRSWCRIFDMADTVPLPQIELSTQSNVASSISWSRGGLDLDALRTQYRKAKDLQVSFPLLVGDYFGPYFRAALADGSQDSISEVTAELGELMARPEAAGVETSGEPTLAPSIGALHAVLGDVRLRHGYLAGAAQAYEASHEIFQRLVRRDPSNSKWQSELSVILEAIGELRLLLGDNEGAGQAFEAVLAIRQDFARRDPSNVGAQHELGGAWARIGDLRLRLGDDDGARQAFETSLSVAQDLSRRDPANAEWQRDLSVMWERVGDIRMRSGDGDGARQAFETSLAISQELCRRDPGNSEWQRDLHISWGKVGAVRQQLGDGDAAQAALEASLEIARVLVRRDPGNVVWQRDLAVANARLAQLNMQAKRFHESLSYWIACHEMLARIHARTPEVPQAGLDFANSAFDVAACLIALERHEEATAYVRSAASLARKLRHAGQPLSQRLAYLLQHISEIEPTESGDLATTTDLPSAAQGPSDK